VRAAAAESRAEVEDAVQDVAVVESMIIKMECGSAALVGHVSLPSLHLAAEKLLEAPTLARGAAAMPNSFGTPPPLAQAHAAPARPALSSAGPRSESALQGPLQGPQPLPSQPAAQPSVDGRIAAAMRTDPMVWRLATLRRWVRGGEYQRLLDSYHSGAVRSSSSLLASCPPPCQAPRDPCYPVAVL
jgi:hypothetical protein